jgi:hypothetical protein
MPPYGAWLVVCHHPAGITRLLPILEPLRTGPVGQETSQPVTPDVCTVSKGNEWTGEMSLPTGRGYKRVRSWGRARNSVGNAWSRTRGQVRVGAIGVGLIGNLLLHGGVDQGCGGVSHGSQQEPGLMHGREYSKILVRVNTPIGGSSPVSWFAGSTIASPGIAP